MTGLGLSASVRLTVGALDLDVDLEVDGAVVAVVGPNGAGKTTLLRALAGLQAVDEGQVWLDGEVLEDTARRVHVPPERRRVGVCFQEVLLFPHLDVVGNVAFGLRHRGIPKATASRRATEWLARVGLEDRARSRPSELSGGEAQRVALARALVTEPRLLLLDEPLSDLDATTRVEVRRLLRRQLDESTAATVVVTHDPLEAMTLAGRLVVVEQGRVVQQGTPDEIVARPRSPYVADLVGRNLFRGRSKGDEIDVAGGGVIVVPGDVGGRADEVFAVVHPRAVLLHRRQPEGTPRNVWQGVVDDVDREGDRARVRVTGRLTIVSEVTMAAVAELELKPGERVWVSVKATEVGVYPA